MIVDAWHEETVQQISAVLEANDEVRGLVLTGSCARPDVVVDAWSDIDLAVIVADSALERFCTASDWLVKIGQPYASNSSAADFFRVLRVHFVDGRRIDCVIVAESDLDMIDRWAYNPLCYENRLLFSRSSGLNTVLEQAFPHPDLQPLSAQEFEQLSDDFWWKGTLAVTKAARNELLVALHLSLDMVRDCLALGMALRDRATSSRHHRDGSEGNRFVGKLEKTQQLHTRAGILTSIEQSARAFDELAIQWTQSYRERHAPLLCYIDRVRRSVVDAEEI